MKIPKTILPTIIISQFFCTSLWFAGNGVMDNLVTDFNLAESDIGILTADVQFGFIIGTLLFAILSIADRYAPSKVFLTCALLGALFNLGIIWDRNTLTSILIFRFFTGFFLAGIYPVGMKIAADYFEQGLGKSLGFLVGALVLGTAFPHLLKEVISGFAWQNVLIVTSLLATIGGIMMRSLVPDGPFRKPSQEIQLSAFFEVFKNPKFRGAAFGYFGHMWELYAFWTFVPIILQMYLNTHPAVNINVPLWSFLIIGIGGLGCVIAGYIAQKSDTAKTAFIALLLSFFCCLISGLIFSFDSKIVFLIFLLFWGMVVVADSPLLSTLVAQNAPSELKGTALTIVNCIGFSITIFSIQLMSFLKSYSDSSQLFTLLAIGPLFGLIALFKIGKLKKM